MIGYGAIGAVVEQRRCFSHPVFWLETWVCADIILVKYVPCHQLFNKRSRLCYYLPVTPLRVVDHHWFDIPRGALNQARETLGAHVPLSIGIYPLETGAPRSLSHTKPTGIRLPPFHIPRSATLHLFLPYSLLFPSSLFPYSLPGYQTWMFSSSYLL